MLNIQEGHIFDYQDVVDDRTGRVIRASTAKGEQQRAGAGRDERQRIADERAIADQRLSVGAHGGDARASAAVRTLEARDQREHGDVFGIGEAQREVEDVGRGAGARVAADSERHGDHATSVEGDRIRRDRTDVRRTDEIKAAMP